MKSENSNLINSKILLLFGLILFAFQGFLAWHFYLERIGSFDPVYFLFLMLQTGEPALPLGRLGSIPSQILPLWAISQDLSLELIMRLYSISFILLYALYFCILHFGLKDKLASIALLPVISTGFYHNFYYSTAELYQGLALGVLVWAFIRKTKDKPFRKRWLWFIAAFLLSVWISFYHQLATLGVLFVIVYELIGVNWRKVPERIVLLILVLVWAFIQFKILSASEYEQGKIKSLLNFSDYDNLLNMPSLKYMYKNIIYFSSLLVLALCTILILIYDKKTWKLVFVVVANVGYTLIHLITYHNGESPIMLENYYSVYGILLAIPFADSLRSKFITTRKYLIPLLLIFILSIAGWQNFHGHHTLTEKINYNKRLIDYLEKQNIHKALLNSTNYPWHYTWVGWTLPFETLITSSIDKSNASVTVCLGVDSAILYRHINNQDVFFGPSFWPVWSVKKQIHKIDYFHFAPETYTQINTPVPDSVGFDLNSKKIKLRPPKKVFTTFFTNYKIVEVAVVNNTADTIHSGIHGETDILLTYSIYDLKGNFIQKDKHFTRLECDIYPFSIYTNGLFLIRPAKPGLYKVIVSLITNKDAASNIKDAFYLKNGI